MVTRHLSDKKEQVTAQSLKCEDCGKLLKDGSLLITRLSSSHALANAAEFHAIKSGHQNFAECTEAIKPLTEEERAEKLKQLQERLALRREEKRQREIDEEKSKEKVRRATGREIVESKEKFKELEMKKHMEQLKREKEEEKAAKARIKALIEADKLERARQVCHSLCRT